MSKSKPEYLTCIYTPYGSTGDGIKSGGAMVGAVIENDIKDTFNHLMDIVGIARGFNEAGGDYDFYSISGEVITEADCDNARALLEDFLARHKGKRRGSLPFYSHKVLVERDRVVK